MIFFSYCYKNKSIHLHTTLNQITIPHKFLSNKETQLTFTKKVHLNGAFMLIMGRVQAMQEQARQSIRMQQLIKKKEICPFLHCLVRPLPLQTQPCLHPPFWPNTPMLLMLWNAFVPFAFPCPLRQAFPTLKIIPHWALKANTRREPIAFNIFFACIRVGYAWYAFIEFLWLWRGE